jgi:hypothetical protein
MLALMLGHEGPVDLLTGQRIDVGKSLSWGNDKEYHHLFPQAYLARAGSEPVRANAVANIVLLSSHSNITIRDASPSDYFGSLVTQVGRKVVLERLASNLVPESALDAALSNDYKAFLAERADHLHGRALSLCGLSETGEELPAGATVIDDADSNPSE